MTIDHRLHHAARELRGVPIDVPPLGMPRRRQPTRILQALAAPMLFVAGGLFAYGAAQIDDVAPVQSDVGAVTPTGVATPDAQAAPVSNRAVNAPSVRAELEMIAEIVSSNQPPAPVAPTSTVEVPPASESTDSVGPI